MKHPKVTLSDYDMHDCGYETPCWIWQRQTDKRGYALWDRHGKTLRVHRVMYELKHGPIPDGFEPHHRCENPPCINPDHLEPVTHKVNIRLSKRATLSEGQVAEIKQTPRPITRGIADELGARYGVSSRHIRNILYGSRWKDAA